MNTWVLCFSRRNAFECTIRSRSRWNGVRRGESSSGATRRAGYERAASGDSVASSSALSRWWKSTLPVVTVARRVGAAGAAARRRRLLAVAGRRLSGRHAGDRHPVRRAAHVVEPRELEERNRLGVAAVLAADPELEVRLGLASGPRREAHEPAHPRPVERLEWAAVQDALVPVAAEEAALGVVAGGAERRLRQIVGPERKEVGDARDAIGHVARPRELDHGPDREPA